MTDIQELDASVELTKALLWQYNNAENLEGLITKKQEWYNENNNEFWDDWLRDVFDLRTANSFGLSVWSIILNLPIAVTQDPSPPKPTWGFGVNNENFNSGNFTNLNSTVVNLTLEQARLVLRLRYFQLVTSGRIPEINNFIRPLFEEQFGVVFAYDNLDMTMTYIFKFDPPQQLRFVLENYDILPRPSGVLLNLLYDPQPGWGFGPLNLNFGNGNFFGS